MTTALGIDLGTSEVKVLLVDAHQQVIASAGEPLTLQRPHPTHSEQHPRDWWAATEGAMQQLRAQAPEAMLQVGAIGLSGQMHGAIALDAEDRVIRPAILWNDGRSAAECAAMMAELPSLTTIAGNLAMPGFTAPKLRWLRAHEPEHFARTRTVLLPKDWLRLQMTGERLSDMSDAAGTLWLDVAHRRWSPELLALTGLTPEHMPGLVEGSAPAGRLRPDVAARWGLPPDVVVAGGGGDNAASAVGIGAVRSGQGFLSLGTSGVVFVVADRCAPQPDRAVHTFCHALPRMWHRMAVMLSAASCLRWACQLLRQPDEATLLAQVEALPATARARAPLFLPYLNGERTPHNDPHAAGVLFGLRAGHGAADVGYAVLEGVAFGLRDGLLCLDASDSRELTVVGGGSRSPLWCQLLASVLGVPLMLPTGAPHGAALGAARLGWLAIGGDVASVCRTPAADRRFDPDAEQAQRSLARYERWRALYPLLRDQFERS